jgi:diaminopimelate decarboxylase
MKKVLFLVIFFCVYTFGFSQTIARTDKNQFGVYDEYFKKWRFEDFKYSDISIRFEPGRFVFDDSNRSIYTVTERMGEKINSDSKFTSWVCFDEKDRKCVVQLIHYYETKENVLTVVYGKTCFVYYITEVKTY